MKITQEFTVHQPLHVVWATFQDIPTVAGCLPGASLTGAKGNNTYGGRVAVKLGPISPTFDGEATITSDEASHTGLIKGTGTDRRGGSRGQLAVTYGIVSAGEGATTVSLDADITLSGAAAQFGRTSVMTEVSSRMIKDFSTCLEAKMSATTPEERAAVRAPEVLGMSVVAGSIAATARSSVESGVRKVAPVVRRTGERVGPLAREAGRRLVPLLRQAGSRAVALGRALAERVRQRRK